MLSLILGFFSSLLPKVLELISKKQDLTHELALLNLQYANADKDRQFRAYEADTNADALVLKAALDADREITQKASQWVININSMVRPSAAFLALGVIVFGAYSTVTGNVYGISMLEVPLIVETCQYVLGYYFGARSVTKLQK